MVVLQPGRCAWVTDTAAPCWSWTSSGAGRSGRSERRTAGSSSLRVLKPPGTSPPMTRSRGAASPDTSTASEPSLRATCPACPPTAGRSRAAVVGAVDGSRRRPGRRPRVAPPRRGRRRLPGQRDAERRGRRVRAPSGLHPDQPRDRRPAGAVGRARPARSTARQPGPGGRRTAGVRLAGDRIVADRRLRSGLLADFSGRADGLAVDDLAEGGWVKAYTDWPDRSAAARSVAQQWWHPGRRPAPARRARTDDGGHRRPGRVRPAGHLLAGPRGGTIVVVDELHGARSGAGVR